MSVRALAREEREDLASFLRTLRPEEWDAPSLCDGWRVRDVVAHVVSFHELGTRGFVGRLVRTGFSPDRANAIGVAEAANRDTDDLLSSLERNAEPRGPLTALRCLPALMDALVHHQDIRRPLGRPRDVPPERLKRALGAVFLSPVVDGPRRARGLRFVATDLEWSRGKGLEVRGAAEAILMAVAGRSVAIDELSGPGRDVLAERAGTTSTR